MSTHSQQARARALREAVSGEPSNCSDLQTAVESFCSTRIMPDILITEQAYIMQLQEKITELQNIIVTESARTKDCNAALTKSECTLTAVKTSIMSCANGMNDIQADATCLTPAAPPSQRR